MVKSKLLVLIAFLVFLVSCGIPREDRKNAEAFPEETKKLSALTKEKEAEYTSKIKSAKDFTEYKIYADREKWEESFKTAREKIALAKKKYVEEIAPILKTNKPEDLQKLRDLTFATNKFLGEARALTNRPFERKAYIESAKKNYTSLAEEAGKALAKTSTPFLALEGAILKAKGDFAERATDLDKRFSPIKKTRDATLQFYKDVIAEKNKADRKEVADFARLADSVKSVRENGNKVYEDSLALSRQVVSLYKSYTKTMVDMKVDYFIQIHRFSWDDGADYPSIHEHRYPVQALTDELFDYFNSLPESTDKIAELRRGWNGDSMTFHIDEGKWNFLKISPRDNWPSSSDDTAEYSFTLSAKYFHKYAEELNGVITTTGWIAVSEELFEDHVDDLGMDIISKPYGVFEEETLKEPAPAGMALVGNPKYGTWKTDSSGNSFWAFYGQYMFFSHLLGSTNPYYYQRGEWEHWNKNYRGKDGYYGEDKDKKERYGSRGYVTGSGSRYSKDISRFRNMSQRHGDSGSVGGKGGAGRTGRGGGSGK